MSFKTCQFFSNSKYARKMKIEILYIVLIEVFFTEPDTLNCKNSILKFLAQKILKIPNFFK